MTGRVEACINLAKKIGIRGKRIIDVGCSNGWFCEVAIAEGAKEVCAIEPEDEKLKLARKAAPKATIKKGFAEKLDFPSNRFDLATLFDVIEHIPKNSEVEVLREINRVLKKGGHLIISTPFAFWLSRLGDPAWYFGHRHYSKESLSDFLKSAGFKMEYSSTRGGAWEVIAIWWLYFTKWVLKIPMPFEEWLDVRRREEFRKFGKISIFVIAKKVAENK